MSTKLRASSFDASPVPKDVRELLGAALAADWRQAFIACGYGWHVDSVAAFATPITGGGAGTVLDLDQPEMGLSVPSGYTMIPLVHRITINPGVNAADNEVTEAAILLDRTAVWAGDGTVVSRTPINLRTNNTTGCPITCFSAATADITDPVVSAILAAKTARANFGDATGMSIEHADLTWEPDYPPFIVGPAAVYMYWGGTVAATGYGMADFLAVPSSLVSSLTR